MNNIKFFLLTIFVSGSFLLSEKLIVKQIAQGYKKPVYLTAPKNQSDTLFVIEQSGRIQTIVHGRTVAPLLDIRERVHKPIMMGDERGLLGMALHPDFQNNGKFYVNYVNRNDTTIISTFKPIEEIRFSMQQRYKCHVLPSNSAGTRNKNPSLI